MRVLFFGADGISAPVRIVPLLEALRRTNDIEGYGHVDRDMAIRGGQSTFDALIVHRNPSARQIAWLRRTEVPFIYDIDDLMLSDSHVVTGRRAREQDAIKWCLNTASFVTSPSRRLLQMLGHRLAMPLGARARYLPSCGGSKQIRSTNPEGKPRLLWVSSHGQHYDEFREVAAGMAAAARAIGTEAVLVGKFAPAIFDVLDKARHVPWIEPRGFESFLAGGGFIAASPMPAALGLPEQAFVDCKSDIKAAQFGMQGIAGLYSPVPPYRESDLPCRLSRSNSAADWEQGLTQAAHEYPNAGLALSQDPFILARQVDRVASILLGLLRDLQNKTACPFRFRALATPAIFRRTEQRLRSLRSRLSRCAHLRHLDEPMPDPRIIEIGEVPLMRQGFPRTTEFFATGPQRSDDLGPNDRHVSFETLPLLRRRLAAGDVDIVVVQPAQHTPWSLRGAFARPLPSQRLMGAGAHPSYARTANGARRRRAADRGLGHRRSALYLCAQFLSPRSRRSLLQARASPRPLAGFHGDRPLAHPDAALPSRAVAPRANCEASSPLARAALRRRRSSRSHSVTAAGEDRGRLLLGRVEQSSTVRARGIAELLRLRAEGVRIDIADKPLPRPEFLHRCARAHIVWSPEGYGWECFRTYEAALCGSVALQNRQTVDRHEPLKDGVHALYYDVEPGELTRVIIAALTDKDRLARIAAAGRAHVLEHHTPAAIARYIVTTTLAHCRDTQHQAG